MRKVGVYVDIEKSFSPSKKVASSRIAETLQIDMGLPEEIIFSPDKVYSTVRAISARVNHNADGFRRNELLGAVEDLDPHNEKFGYRTFIGKNNHVDHYNMPELADEDPRHTPRGKILAATYHEDPYTEVYMEGFPDPAAKSLLDPVTKLAESDAWVRLLIENDRKKFPVLCEAIEQGLVTKVSMGAEIINSSCSVCGNTARHEFEFCDHARFGRGQVYAAQSKSPFVRFGAVQVGDPIVAFEDNHGLQFFEESWILDVQADPTAMILDLIKGEPGMSHSEVTAAIKRVDKVAHFLSQKKAIEDEGKPKVNINIDNIDEYLKSQKDEDTEEEDDDDGEDDREAEQEQFPEPDDYTAPANEWGEGEFAPEYPFPCSARTSAAEANPDYPIDATIDVEVCFSCMYNRSDKVGVVECAFPEVVREGGSDPLPADFEGADSSEDETSGFLNADGSKIREFPGIEHPPQSNPGPNQ